MYVAQDELLETSRVIHGLPKEEEELLTLGSDQERFLPVSQISLKILADSSMLDWWLSSFSVVGPLKSITLNFSSVPNLGSVNCTTTARVQTQPDKGYVACTTSMCCCDRQWSGEEEAALDLFFSCGSGKFFTRW